MGDATLSVGDVARRLGVSPRVITNLLYDRHVKVDEFPIVGGRRLIPERFICVIVAALRRRGIQVREPVQAGVTANHGGQVHGLSCG